jgi:peptidoglycan/LPS O-acetylase OafA/YrhL
MSSIPARGSRSPAIDILKGLAICSVICLHTLSIHRLHETLALFHIWQAVPIFMFLMGLNAAASLRRRGGSSLRELYSREYLASRFDRIYVPFLVAFAATLLVAVLTHTPRLTIGSAGGLVLGWLPSNGPGIYFITLTFQFALLFPLLLAALRRAPLPTLVVCLVIDVAFESIAPRVGVIRSRPYLYEDCVARYLFLVALGALLAGFSPDRLLRSWWLWVGALMSAAYLVLVSVAPGAIPFAETDWRGQTFASVFYTILIVALGMRLLPSVGHRWLSRELADLGRASYHVFLVQITWFGLVGSPGSLAMLPVNLAVTLIVGLVFYRLMARAPLPSIARLLARREVSFVETTH